MDGAFLAGAVRHPELEVGGANIPAGAEVVADAGTLTADTRP